MQVIAWIFEAGSRSQVSLSMKLQESDGAVIEKGPLHLPCKEEEKLY